MLHMTDFKEGLTGGLDYNSPYVMVKKGDPKDEANYIYVGNASVLCPERDEAGRPIATYHLGVAALNRLVCDRTTGLLYPHREPMPTDDIPPTVINTAIKEVVNMPPLEPTFQLLASLGVTPPENPDIVSLSELYAMLFDASPEEIKATREKLEHWRKIGKQILEDLDLSDE